MLARGTGNAGPGPYSLYDRLPELTAREIAFRVGGFAFVRGTVLVRSRYRVAPGGSARVVGGASVAERD